MLFLQYDCIGGVVNAIKGKDGEKLLDTVMKCGFGKTVQHDVLWLDEIPEGVSESNIAQEFIRFGPTEILYNRDAQRALVWFNSPESAKQILYELKTKVLRTLQVKLKMDYAGDNLVDDFTNNMRRAGLSTDRYKVPQRDSVYGSPSSNLPKMTVKNTLSAPRNDDASHREELEKKLDDLKRENIQLLNQMSNEKATNGQIDPVQVAICDDSNVLRSMEIHRLLAQKRDVVVKSYGVGKKVRIAADATTEIEFDYKLSYLDIASGIAKMKDHNELFKRNGTIELLAKNREIKAGPENFMTSNSRFDIVFTTEYYMIDKVISLLDKLVAKGQIPDPVSRNNGFGSTCHVINIDIGDFRQDAILGAQIVSKLMDMISALPEPDRQISKLLKKFRKKSGTEITHIAVQLH